MIRPAAPAALVAALAVHARIGRTFEITSAK
jgi:hypothetical protein